MRGGTRYVQLHIKLVLLVYINSALHRNDINGGHGTAVSLPRAIVGTRHCRLLYIIRSAAGIDITGLLVCWLCLLTNVSDKRAEAERK